jgi:hypothetical protein
MKIYSDSIDRYSEYSPSIPLFLFDECFDMKPLFWIDLHHPISLRKYVAQHVSNTHALILILDKLSINEKYKRCAKFKMRIPDDEKSFAELLLERKKELEDKLKKDGV